MYIGIYYSARDKAFAQELAESFSHRAFPVFLDECDGEVDEYRDVRVDDKKETPTHAIIVLSYHSVHSAGFKERLSRKKIEQLARSGCHILTLNLLGIEKTEMPGTVAHMKSVHWGFSEPFHCGYWLDFRNLLIALELKAEHLTSDELRVIQHHLSSLTTIYSMASSAFQFFYQMERLWNYLNRDPDEVHHWYFETVIYTWDVKLFRKEWGIFEKECTRIDSGADTLDEMVELCRTVQEDFSFWDDRAYDINNPEAAYRRLVSAEENSKTLAVLLSMVFLELQNALVS